MLGASSSEEWIETIHNPPSAGTVLRQRGDAAKPLVLHARGVSFYHPFTGVDTCAINEEREVQLPTNAEERTDELQGKSNQNHH